MLTIYGIKNCNTMKKAFDFLNAHGVAYEFFDYKKQVLSQDKFDDFVQIFGSQVINKQGTTYRKFDDNTKATLETCNTSAMYEIIKDNPSVLKRPIVLGKIGNADVALIGFDEQKYTQTFTQS
ncbi:Spx/MgsR family RNA polymerase-binding regulatory protein [Moraxella nasovis]|uniref:Spx/MgsR family RNA polymerase-binding regulatory protein n=1 Tax=Moraxella nasovis TaxID=2904121 RepID=UPI001F61D006|nr:Spx/MgsR family RNA polymerase-binding regulatory protein [Moraxella nasovis]UNU72925.1 Spx/MgsR family RNA polymerase-binding regulatory protein [Moraxella nasovis]